MNHKHNNKEGEVCTQRRRVMALAAAGLLSAGNWPAQAARKDDPRRAPPQPGDPLAYPSFEHDDRLVLASELEAGQPPLLVYPRDVASGQNRERSRLNQILLLRFAADELPPAIAPLATDGIIAYSGVCTHTACGVSEWDAEAFRMVCPCHGSAFDPKAAGKPVAGPAPRALPTLPINIDGDHVVVAGSFSARVGAKK